MSNTCNKNQGNKELQLNKYNVTRGYKLTTSDLTKNHKIFNKRLQVNNRSLTRDYKLTTKLNKLTTKLNKRLQVSNNEDVD